MYAGVTAHVEVYWAMCNLEKTLGFFFLTFYFAIILDTQSSYKKSTRVSINIFYPTSPNVNLLITGQLSKLRI